MTDGKETADDVNPEGYWEWEDMVRPTTQVVDSQLVMLERVWENLITP